MQEKDLNLENKAIITMAQFKEYEELKENVGKIKIEIGRLIVNYSRWTPNYSTYLSLETDNIPNEILEVLKTNIDDFNKLSILKTELDVELEKERSENRALINILTDIKSKWWYKLFNK